MHKIWQIAGYVVLAGFLGAGCSDSTSESDEKVIDVNNSNTVNSVNAENNLADAGQPDSAQRNNNDIQPLIDLRADANRDGVVDFADASDDQGEDLWSTEVGAIFLPNIDDDDHSCNLAADDSVLAGCFDGADDELDGPDDLLDLAPLYLRVMDEVPDSARVSLTATSGAEHVRVFDITTSQRVDLPANFAAGELRTGLKLGVEGKDVMRTTAWDGVVEFQASIDGDEAATDTVQMRSAPLILRHHLDPALEIYSSELGVGGDGAFTADLQAATAAAGVPGGHVEIPVQDQWAQDYFETAYLAMPGPDGPRVINVYIRSANLEADFFGAAALREAGRAVYQMFHGPDSAGLTAVDATDHSADWDSLNSFGNTETIPPYTNGDETYPVGRIIRGHGNGDRGDGGMRNLLDAQQIQAPLYVSTGWLFVSHIDETLSFVAAPQTERGWVMLANDARMAIDLLESIQDDGRGDTLLFQDKYWLNFRGREYRADVPVSDVLNDPDLMAANAEAIIEVDEQIRTVKEATGLTDDEIISVPFLHMEVSGYSVAYQPGTVNGVVTDASNFLAPDPHGPVIDGVDVMKKAFEDQITPFGVTIRWIEDWDMFHRLNGEVHCGSNALRAQPSTPWWEASQ